GGVDEFDDRRELHLGRPGIAERLGTQEHDQRTQAFAAAGDDIAGELVDQHDVRREPALDFAVDRVEFAANERLDGVEVHGGGWELIGRHARGGASPLSSNLTGPGTLVRIAAFSAPDISKFHTGTLPMYAVIESGGKQYRVAPG